MKQSVSKSLCTLFTISLMNTVHAKQPIILWDIHDVLISRSGFLTTALNYNELWNMTTHTNFWLLKDSLSLGLQNLFTETSIEEYIDLARLHHNPYLKEFIVHLANSQQPIPGMQELVTALHQAGYEQHVASNIGLTAFKELKNSKRYPHLAPLFEHIDPKKSLVVSKINGTYIKKPAPLFFATYLQKNSIDPQKQPIIFIDNDGKNIEAARSMGIDGILFINPEQLRLELQKRNITLPAL